MKTYSRAPDVEHCIDRMQRAHHEQLTEVTVSALFVFDSESGDHVLKHQGYPAGAVVKINSLRDRALGISDATIVVDRCEWLVLSQRQRDALIDHELTHLTRKLDEETEKPAYDAIDRPKPAYDAIDRPKLIIRMHDHQLGWFDEVARRHGDASLEQRQARKLLESSRQLYFDFRAETAHGPGDDDDDEDDEGMSGTGRAIQMSARRAAAKARGA